jgi:hypothetical protein
LPFWRTFGARPRRPAACHPVGAGATDENSRHRRPGQSSGAGRARAGRRRSRGSVSFRQAGSARDQRAVAGRNRTPGDPHCHIGPRRFRDRRCGEHSAVVGDVQDPRRGVGADAVRTGGWQRRGGLPLAFGIAAGEGERGAGKWMESSVMATAPARVLARNRTGDSA